MWLQLVDQPRDSGVQYNNNNNNQKQQQHTVSTAPCLSNERKLFMLSSRLSITSINSSMDTWVAASIVELARFNDEYALMALHSYNILDVDIDRMIEVAWNDAGPQC